MMLQEYNAATGSGPGASLLILWSSVFRLDRTFLGAGEDALKCFDFKCIVDAKMFELEKEPNEITLELRLHGCCD
jgi:hypothetical protein